MFFPPELGSSFEQNVKPIWESASHPDNIRMFGVWATLTELQGRVISHLIREKIGHKIYQGPFKGMELLPDVLKGHYAPYLLGTYENEIHEAVEQAIARAYAQVINIGCSYGYYTIGLARRMPQTKVYAYDIDADSRKTCAAMAAVNGVEDRVATGNRFYGEDYARMAGPPTLVFMDIEGDELDLLDPERFPSLRGMDVIVEIHDCNNPSLSRIIPERFAATHNVSVIPNKPSSFPLREILGPEYKEDHFDSRIATWEIRSGPTPWGVFIRK